MDVRNDVITKAEAMDKLMHAYDKEISTSAIFAIVHQIFQFDVESISDLPTPPRAAMDAYLADAGNGITGSDIRRLFNQTLGINLDALSHLEGAQFSLYSKGHWMLQQPNDLFVIHTGTGDVDVRIVTTSYFAEQTGSNKLPIHLINELLPLGFDYEEKSRGYYYANPTGEAVSDAFKGQTIMAIRKVIQQSYSPI
jgi:hypothetical protein